MQNHGETLDLWYYKAIKKSAKSEAMIRKIHIQNFKSIYDLEIDVGRVNLFIGENGSGKSNLLEALVFVSAGESNKLDNEFLVSRGLRVTESFLMRSAFEEEDKDKDIKIKLFTDDRDVAYSYYNDDTEYSEWSMSEMILDESSEEVKILNHGNEIRASKDLNNYIESLDIELLEKLRLFFKSEEVKRLRNFLIYSPENTSLRTFESDGQIQPLGINGEGLLKLLKVVNNYEDKSYIQTIIKSLQLFNWFEDVTIPTDLSSMEDKVIIKDKYLYREIDQRSANEGFLFILFYITLIVAKETPKTFAIDNIDASLNQNSVPNL
jgi:AAA15 family ATPase/GTPase